MQDGESKSGGYRVITFYSGDDIPVFFPNIFAKGEKVNLTKAKQYELRAISLRMWLPPIEEESDAMSKAGSRILTSARQALAYATGEADTSQYGVHVPEHLDVRTIRQTIRMSQEEFARHFA